MNFIRRISLGCVVAVSAALVACSPSAPVPAPPEIVGALLEMAYPSVSIEIAVAIEVQNCMKPKGFETSFDVNANSWANDQYAAIAGLFRSADDANGGYRTTFRQSQDAYGFDLDLLSRTQRSAFESELYGPTEQQRVSHTYTSGVQMSVGSVGCLADALRAVYGSLESALWVTSVKNEVSQIMALGDGEQNQILMTVLPAYIACMASDGYHVSGLTAPQLAEEEFGRYRRRGEAPSTEEKVMAQADFSCQADAGLEEAVVGHFASLAGGWAKENQGMILLYRESYQAALERAQEIIDGD